MARFRNLLCATAALAIPVVAALLVRPHDASPPPAYADGSPQRPEQY
jgi:hypothetical protein